MVASAREPGAGSAAAAPQGAGSPEAASPGAVGAGAAAAGAVAGQGSSASSGGSAPGGGAPPSGSGEPGTAGPGAAGSSAGAASIGTAAGGTSQERPSAVATSTLVSEPREAPQPRTETVPPATGAVAGPRVIDLSDSASDRSTPAPASPSDRSAVAGDTQPEGGDSSLRELFWGEE